MLRVILSPRPACPHQRQPPLPPTPATARYDVLAGLRPGGTVLINAPWRSFEELERHMHPRTRARLAELRPKVGIPNHINSDCCPLEGCTGG